MTQEVWITWTRHGESETNAIARYAPFYRQLERLLWLDPALTPYGRRTAGAKSIRRKLGRPPPDIVISSRLLRAIQTAQLIYPGQPVYAMYGLREIVFGLGNHTSSPEEQQPFLDKPSLVTYVGSDAQDNVLPVFWENLTQFLHVWMARTGWVWGKRPLRIAVVGHSRYFRFYMGFIMDKNLRSYRTRYYCGKRNGCLSLTRIPGDVAALVHEGSSVQKKAGSSS